MDPNKTLKQSVAAATEAWVEASLTRLSLPMLLSSVTGLSAFVEDELIAPTMPLFISLRNVEVTLIEDRPLVRVGGPAPAVAPPLIVRLKHVLVQRDQAGVLSVGVSESRSSSKSSFIIHRMYCTRFHWIIHWLCICYDARFFRFLHVRRASTELGWRDVGLNNLVSVFLCLCTGESCHDVTSRESSLQLKIEQLERENEELRKRLNNSKLI